MRKILYIVIIILLLISISWIVYLKLPFEITRKSDIKFGNELILKIENYKKDYFQLPPDNDWELLKKLGFKMEMLGTKPGYTKISDDEYELTYFEGFDGPYLLYNSKEKRWKVDFPKFPFKNEEMELNFPWSKNVTKTAVQAIQISIVNTNNPHSPYCNENFPTDIKNMPFIQKEMTEFEIVGYSYSDSLPTIYRIDFYPKNSYKSGPRITVEIDIENEKAIRVYMTPDA